MGGQVSVNSQEGVGTNFVIDIKAKCKATRTVFTAKEEFVESLGKINVQDRSQSVIQSCLQKKMLMSNVRLAQIENGAGIEVELENENRLNEFYQDMVLKVK